MARHVRTGDKVIVTSGSAKGQVGEVKQILTKTDRVLVEGVNLGVRIVKPSQANPQGGTIQAERSIHISNVSPVVDGKPSRVRFETKADGAKVRIAVRSGKALSEVRSSDAKKKS